jgi:hypothetical protein
LILDICPPPGAPGSPNHESLGTWDIAIDILSSF